MPNTHPNYLATRLEQQAAKATSLPASVNQKLNQLFDYTLELKTILVDSLPNEILQNLLVVGFDKQQLTLAVDSQTAANHLIYLNQPLTSLIASQSLTFNKLNNIKVIVTYIPNKTGVPSIHQANHTGLHHIDNQTKSLKNPSENPVQMGLPPKTKQTITQTIDHVISDEALKESLRKLLD